MAQCNEHEAQLFMTPNNRSIKIEEEPALDQELFKVVMNQLIEDCFSKLYRTKSSQADEIEYLEDFAQ